MAFLIGLALCAIGWWLWPTGILDLTFAAITLGMLLKAIAAAFFGMAGVGFFLASLDS